MLFQNLNHPIVNHDENLEKPNKSLIAGCVVSQWQFSFDIVQKLLGILQSKSIQINLVFFNIARNCLNLMQNCLSARSAHLENRYLEALMYPNLCINLLEQKYTLDFNKNCQFRPQCKGRCTNVTPEFVPRPMLSHQ